jgi:ribonuclease H
LGELNAVLELLNATAQAGLADEDLHILADSQYAINVISKWSPGWKKRGWVKADKKPIKNLELIQEIDRAMQGRTVTFEWVKGHAGHPLNERADDAARSCAEAYRDGRVIPRGPGFASPAESRATEFEPSTPTAEAASTGREIPGDATDVQTPEEALERQFLDAWLRADSQALKALQAPGCIRIWHNGSLTQGLEGRAPEHAESSNFQVNRLQGTSSHHNTAENYPDAWVITYVLTWTGGKLRESSTWVAGENGPRILMHQSSPISAR